MPQGPPLRASSTGAGWVIACGSVIHALSEHAPLVVGRTSESNVVLEDASVSRRHASFRLVHGVPQVEDVGSRHGTYVNGARVGAATPLRHGDRIRVGGQVLVIHDVGRLMRDRQPTQPMEAPEPPRRLRAQTVPDRAATGEHDPAAALATEIQLLVDAGESSGVEALVDALLRCWSGAPQAPMDESVLRRGASSILRAASPGRAAWIDALIRVHHTRGVLMHASTLDQLEPALLRVPGVHRAGLAAYVQWLRDSGSAVSRGEYGAYCLSRLDALARTGPR